MAVRYVEIGQYPDVRREVRGKLSEILVATANPGTYAAPEDVTGTYLEMGTDGKWDGASVGTLTQVQADALVASGAMGAVKAGVRLSIAGAEVVWDGAALVPAPVVGPFASTAEANAWATANPGSAVVGVIAMVAGVSSIYRDGAWVAVGGGVGRFEKPEDWSIWASMYSSNLELGQLITVGDSILKWTATGVKFVDAVFATQADFDSFCSKIGTPIATGSTATVAGVAKQWNGTGWVRQIANYGKNIIAVLGDSIAAATGSHLEQAIFRMGYRLAGRFAVAGSKIEDQSKKISAIKAAGADTVYIHVGANNWQDTGAQIYSKYVKLFGELYANGLRVVVSSPGPQGNSLQSITHKMVVACYYAAKQFDFQVIDALGIYSTENAGWEVGKSLDNLHPLAATRSEAADLFVSKLQSGNDSIPVIRSRTESLLANPCFALDSDADGLSDSWTKTGTVSGGTLVVAREPDGALGHYKQTIKITNPTINDDQFVCQTLTPAAGYAPGDVLLASMVYDYSRPADTNPAITDPCVPQIQAQGTLYGFPQIYNGLLGTFGAPVIGAVATREFTVDSTYINVRISAGLRAVSTPPAGDYMLKIYRVGLVNLTALGIV